MRYIYLLLEEIFKRLFENLVVDIRWVILLYGIIIVFELYGMYDIINIFNDYFYGNKYFIKIIR